MDFLRNILAVGLVLAGGYRAEEPTKNVILAQSENHYEQINSVTKILAEEEDVEWEVLMEPNSDRTTAFKPKKVNHSSSHRTSSQTKNP